MSVSPDCWRSNHKLKRARGHLPTKGGIGDSHDRPQKETKAFWSGVCFTRAGASVATSCPIGPRLFFCLTGAAFPYFKELRKINGERKHHRCAGRVANLGQGLQVAQLEGSRFLGHDPGRFL